MEKHLLIAPVGGEIGSLLLEGCLGAGYQVTAGFEKSADHELLDAAAPSGTNGKDSGSDSQPIVWDGRSFLSIRNLLLTATNRHHGIDRTVVIYEPPSGGDALHLLSPTAIERAIDTRLTGLIILAREVMAAAVARGGGALSLILAAPDVPVSAVSSATTAAFAACAESLRTESENSPIEVSYFESRKSDQAGFVAFILENLDREADGRSFRYGSGPLGRLRLGGSK